MTMSVSLQLLLQMLCHCIFSWCNKSVTFRLNEIHLPMVLAVLVGALFMCSSGDNRCSCFETLGGNKQTSNILVSSHLEGDLFVWTTGLEGRQGDEGHIDLAFVRFLGFFGAIVTAP